LPCDCRGATPLDTSDLLCSDCESNCNSDAVVWISVAQRPEERAQSWAVGSALAIILRPLASTMDGGPLAFVGAAVGSGMGLVATSVDTHHRSPSAPRRWHCRLSSAWSACCARSVFHKLPRSAPLGTQRFQHREGGRVGETTLAGSRRIDRVSMRLRVMYPDLIDAIGTSGGSSVCPYQATPVDMWLIALYCTHDLSLASELA
jgi:hypothetical protein